MGGDYYSSSTNSYDFWLIKIAPDPNDVGPQDLNYIPETFILKQNYPNPFNPKTTIKFQIPELSFVTIEVYDVLGNEIVTIVNEVKQAGYYEVEFDGNGLSSGIYFYQLKTGVFFETKKMVLLR